MKSIRYIRIPSSIRLVPWACRSWGVCRWSYGHRRSNYVRTGWMLCLGILRVCFDDEGSRWCVGAGARRGR